MIKPFVQLMMFGALLVLGACWGGQDSGPVEIRWDRDNCELCKMFVSDPRFAAEVRGGEKNKVYKFDDIGCAVNWLNGRSWAGDANTEIWVAAMTSTRDQVTWLDAREARYVKAEMTPMNYGYGALPPNSTGTGIDFRTMTSTILAHAPNHICKAPELDA